MSKCTLKIYSVGPAKQFGFWGGHRVSSEVEKAVRSHKITYYLEDEDHPDKCLYWWIKFVYKLGGKGKSQFLALVDDVIKEYGDFEGLIEDKRGNLKVTEKTEKIRSELVNRIKVHNRTICGIPIEKKYNLQEILISIGVTKEMWEQRQGLPWLIQWFRLSRKMYNKLYHNDRYEAFFMGLSHDAELWYEEDDDMCYAYFEPDDMSLECYKWEDLLDMDEYVDVRFKDKDSHPLKDSEGNWIKECSPEDMQLTLIVDFGAGDIILKELVDHIEDDED